MLAIAISWFSILIVFLSFGDLLVSLYNRICKQQETYFFVDTFLLGMTATCILLGISSLWLPSNHYILFTYFLFIIGYWIIRKQRLADILTKARDGLSELTLIQKVLFLVIILSFFIPSIWAYGFFDSLYYHLQHIQFNEQYAVIPGLGNLDDRFGFNSNYLLLSAIFSFKFIFGDVVCVLQSLSTCIIFGWVTWELIRSKFEIKRIILFISLCLMLYLTSMSVLDTSTDCLPNLICFYLISRIILNSSCIEKKKLLFGVIPVLLITLKLSTVPLLLLTLYIIVSLAKQKKVAPIMAILIVSLLTIIPWLIRNAILSGYLIYPLYQFDFFSFDWKIPTGIAVKQIEYIKTIGSENIRRILGNPLNNMYWINNIKSLFIKDIATAGLYFIVILSPLAFVWRYIKNKASNKDYLFVYAIIILCIAMWLISGPDIRFIAGIICPVPLLMYVIVAPSKKMHHSLIIGKVSLILFSLLMLFSAINYSKDHYVRMNTSTISAKQILIKPHTFEEQQCAKGIDINRFHRPYRLNDNIEISIFVGDVSFGRMPAAVLKHKGRFQDFRMLQARGNSLQEGFRYKK